MIKQSKKFSKIRRKFAQLKKMIREEGLTADKVNSRYQNQYASIQRVREVIEPVIEDNGWVQTVEMDSITSEDGGVVDVAVTVRLTYLGGFLGRASGEWIEMTSKYPLNCYPTDSNGGLPNPQKMEATRTYGSRCTMLALVGISAELDDDGNQAVNTSYVQSISSTKDFDSMLNDARNYKDIVNVLSSAEEACKLGSLSKTALQMIEKKAEKLCEKKSIARQKEHEIKERSKAAMDKLDRGMQQATSLREIEEVWYFYQKYETSFDENQRKLIKYNLKNESDRIVNSLSLGKSKAQAPIKPVQPETTQKVSEVQTLVDSIDNPVDAEPSQGDPSSVVEFGAHHKQAK